MVFCSWSIANVSNLQKCLALKNSPYISQNVLW